MQRRERIVDVWGTERAFILVENVVMALGVYMPNILWSRSVSDAPPSFHG